MNDFCGWDGRFTKLTGAGNDFIVIADLDGRVNHELFRPHVNQLCDRNFGIGADGVIILRCLGGSDVQWVFYNSDGSEAEMCGNGARCAARFVFDNHLVTTPWFHLHTAAGVVRIECAGQNLMRLHLTQPFDHRSNYSIKTIKTEYLLSSINTGVPHAVLRVHDIESFDLLNVAPEIRFHEIYPRGTNVNAYEKIAPDTIRVRTYERGVEGETMSCGTGSVASAIVASLDDQEVAHRVTVVTNGGELLIEFDRELQHVTMSGEAHVLFRGEIDPELLQARPKIREVEV
ncbi:diaminopimelate epimerase [Chrysiogenes arsenatis]|uniref:diaminopimelate epimerase n=1 Tax=Chrysiogenes arsenatis TaxID=309797 RepID=UPI00040E43D9|nr:diaminopimelate epimerase [Chrysiogenes arsenatis]